MTIGRLATMAAAITLSGTAFGGYTITQSPTPDNVYSGHSITFDDAGVPVGVSEDPWTHYQASDGIWFTSGNGFMVADDWDALAGIDAGQGDGNQLTGGFSVRMHFDAPIQELSWQGWADGSPAPPFGGINVFVFSEGVQVAAYSGFSPFGGAGDEWFNVVADGEDTFDEIVFFNGAFSSFQSYVDNVTFNSLVTCTGDVNGDGIVNFMDVLQVIIHWGPCEGGCTADLNGDEQVNFMDLLLVFQDWGCGLTDCSGHGDCDDGDPCTHDICIGGHCYHIPIPGCQP
ncbi:MAG: dockerin type I domain-containing protein [Planctomycetota bacterium]|jgi:hypothetical protein